MEYCHSNGFRVQGQKTLRFLTIPGNDRNVTSVRGIEGFESMMHDAFGRNRVFEVDTKLRNDFHSRISVERRSRLVAAKEDDGI
jgi:hypothetical protein